MNTGKDEHTSSLPDSTCAFFVLIAGLCNLASSDSPLIAADANQAAEQTNGSEANDNENNNNVKTLNGVSPMRRSSSCSSLRKSLSRGTLNMIPEGEHLAQEEYVSSSPPRPPPQISRVGQLSLSQQKISTCSVNIVA